MRTVVWKPFIHAAAAGDAFSRLASMIHPANDMIVATALRVVAHSCVVSESGHLDLALGIRSADGRVRNNFRGIA